MSAAQSSTPASRRCSPEMFDTCRTTAYELYRAGNHPQAEFVCRGLVLADPLDWYHHSLLAATLHKQGRFAEAITILDRGLALLDAHPHLLALRRATAQAAVRAACQMMGRSLS